MSKGMEPNSTKKRTKARQPDSRVNESVDTDLNKPQPLARCPTPELTLTLTLAQSLEGFLPCQE